MARQKQSRNPFYSMLVVVGVLFAVTSCAYCVMAFRAVVPSPEGEASRSGLQLMQFLDAYGMWLLLGEVVLLAVATVGAITTDSYWNRPSTDTSAAARGADTPSSPSS